MGEKPLAFELIGPVDLSGDEVAGSEADAILAARDREERDIGRRRRIQTDDVARRRREQTVIRASEPPQVGVLRDVAVDPPELAAFVVLIGGDQTAASPNSGRQRGRRGILPRRRHLCRRRARGSRRPRSETSG